MTSENMTKLTCDRCASVTYAPGNRRSPGWVRHSSPTKNSGIRVDLCMDCRKSFDLWLRDNWTAGMNEDPAKG